MTIDLDRARETFEASTDFTVGLEEEFAILDPATLELEHRFEELATPPAADEVLADAAAGELIASEIEIRSGPRRELRRRDRAPARARAGACSRSPTSMGLALGATGTHPWADYLDQRIIDTQHYRRARATSCGGSRSATTPGACTSTWACAGADRAVRGLRPAARGAAAAARRLRQLAVPRPPRHAACTRSRTEIFTRDVPALRRARRRSATGTPTRTSSTS